MRLLKVCYQSVFVESLKFYFGSACKESGVRQPGASGFCYWASEFCFQLARRGSDIFEEFK